MGRENSVSAKFRKHPVTTMLFNPPQTSQKNSMSSLWTYIKDFALSYPDNITCHGKNDELMVVPCSFCKRPVLRSLGLSFVVWIILPRLGGATRLLPGFCL